MADDLDAAETWVGGLIARLEPAARRRLAQAVAQDLRRAQVERIAAQRNPDGSPFAARKRQPLRARMGRMKRRAGAMFQKLRRPSYLRAAATPDEAVVGFPNAQVSRIARVHQEGLRDRVTRSADAPEAEYPARVLLGYTDADRERLLDLVLEHLDA